MNAFTRLHTHRATVLTLLGLFFVSAMLYGSQVRAEAQWSLAGFGQAAWTYSSQTVSSLFHRTNAGYTPVSPNPVSAPMLAPVPPAGCTLTTTMGSNGTAQAINDNATTTSTIVIAGAGAYLWDVDALTAITHMFSGDLNITLTSPAGTVVTLTSDNGGGNDNVFNGTTWDDDANPGGAIPNAFNNGLVTDHAYVNNVVATPLAPEDKLAAFIGENPNGTWTLRIHDDATGDTGSLANWSLTVATLPSAPMAAAPGAGSNNTAQAIPDNTGSITSTINIAGAGAVIGNVTAFTNITHTFSGDIQATITSPAGTIVTLTSNNGGGLDNVFAGTTWGDKNDLGNQVPFPSNTFAASNLVTDTIYTNLVTRTPLVPEEALGAFIGENPNGTWTLTVADTFGNDVGTLNSWSLNIATVTCGACSVTCPANITVSAGAACNAVVTYPAPTTSGTCGTVICSPPSGGTFALGTTTINCFSANGCNTIYGIVAENTLISFNPATPGTTTSVAITGLAAGETVQAIDFRPVSGELYGGVANMGISTLRLVKINPTTGVVTSSVGAPFPVGGSFLGFDFNPTVDRIRIVSDSDINLRVNPDTGAVTTDTNLNPGNPAVVAAAYANNFAGATTTTLYGIDFGTDMLVIQNPPNNGTLTNVGALGVNTAGNAQFDISQCGTPYAALQVGSNTGLYRIDLTTGAATLIGAIGSGATLRGMAAAPPSPPQSCSFTVTVNDTAPPVITCPANVTVSAGAACNAVVTYAVPTATDNCPGAVTVACSPASGSTFLLGTTTVTCTASDASALSPDSMCTFTVTVQDTTTPAITCPAPIIVGTASATGTSVSYANATATDNCPGVGTPTCTPASDSNFPLGVTTVTCTVADAAGNTATCSFPITVNRLAYSLTDPLVCTGPGNTVNGSFTITNNGNAPVVVIAVVALPAAMPVVPGSCVANVGTCTINSSTNIGFSATLAVGQTATVSFLAQVGDVATGTQLNSLLTVQFGTPPGPLFQVPSFITVNCPALGPGAPYPSTSALSDQKAGSVLIYPVYTSDAANGASQNTRLSITNVHPSRGANVHLFFVDGSSCSVADSFICLTANQTASVLASDIDPGTTGYLIAIATDGLGCPINFNFLIGDEFVKFASGHMTNLGAEAVSAIAGGLPACDANSVSATLNFNGVSYNLLPRVIASSNLQARADGNDTLLIVDRIGGSLVSGASTLFGLFGLMYDDAEKGVSFQIPGASRCQYRATINNDLRTTPRYETIIPGGRTGWMKLWSVVDVPIIGVQINRNPNAASNSGAFNQGHNLHKLTLTSSGSVTIPIFPPNCN